ncbi:sensor histidine kinase [Streptomyces sp. SBT349]|uniref:sensor histidine kinase n=1 Tax=Streptomyces sp. SBT349 TaxID=1580539 RepID=UPI00066A59B8|nr:HAMP domain-containing sensor histidine kinase [Streptomyces sp. SBT349]
MTLRARLVLITAGLSALALVAANAAGLVLLRTYLTDRVDQQLTTASSDETGNAEDAEDTGDAEDEPGPGTDAFTSERIALLLAPATAGGRGGDEGLPASRFDASGRIFVLGPEGTLLAAVPGADDPGGPRLPGADALRARVGEPFTVDGGWRLHARSTPDGGLVVNAVSLAEVEATVDRLLLIDAAVLGVVLLLLGAGAAWLIRLGLRPLTRMETTAGHIRGGDFARRVRGADPRTEPGRLGAAMNAMLDRVESEITARRDSERSLRHFLSDASHELRTPLTSIRGFAELARRGGDRDEALARIEAEATRMGVLVEDLLLLARLDERPRPERRPVDLLELAGDLVQAARARDPRREVALDRPVPVTVCGDALRLRQVISNLLANALTHTPPGARVVVRVGETGETAFVDVADTGPGVAPEHVPRIFDRLYRTAPGGTGLGLPIATALARAHGGTVVLHANTPGAGATFRLELPRARP